MKKGTVKVRNMTSDKGNTIANQFIINTDDGVYFQSYDSVIIHEFHRDGQRVTQLDENTWDYSVTTGKYRNQFLGEGIAETRKKIESGEYELTNLNA